MHTYCVKVLYITCSVFRSSQTRTTADFHIRSLIHPTSNQIRHPCISTEMVLCHQTISRAPTGARGQRKDAVCLTSRRFNWLTSTCPVRRLAVPLLSTSTRSIQTLGLVLDLGGKYIKILKPISSSSRQTGLLRTHFTATMYLTLRWRIQLRSVSAFPNKPKAKARQHYFHSPNLGTRSKS